MSITLFKKHSGYHSQTFTLYHYVGCINVICSLHSRQSGESDPCSLRCGEAERWKKKKKTLIQKASIISHWRIMHTFITSPCCCHSNMYLLLPSGSRERIERLTYRIMEIYSNFGIRIVFNNLLNEK